MKKILGYVMVMAFAAIACSDDDGPKLTVEQYVTAAKNGWVYESILFKDPDTGIELDLLEFPGLFEACDLDNATIFAADGKYSVANNTRCDDDEPATLGSGTWTLNSSKTTLSVAGDTTIVIQKLQVNNTYLKGEVSGEIMEGFEITAQVTMKKKV